MNKIPHLIISPVYNHHNKNGGYIRLADYTHPLKSILIKDGTNQKKSIFQKYRFLNEMKLISDLKLKPELIHIYFGEECLRFLPYMVRNIPIVATFHQPADFLEEEVQRGDFQGRLYGLAHQLTRGRFNKLAAAIILDESQRSVLEQVMAPEKIHLIPHGIDLEYTESTTLPTKRDRQLILTVGNWQRNWEQYEEIIRYFDQLNSDITFRLVAKNAPEHVIVNLKRYACFDYQREVSDNELEALYQKAYVMLLPLRAGTANNALLEGLKYQIPIIASDVFENPSYRTSDALILVHSTESFITQLDEALNLEIADYEDKQKAAEVLVNSLSWPRIAEQVNNLYQKCIEMQ